MGQYEIGTLSIVRRQEAWLARAEPAGENQENLQRYEEMRIDEGTHVEMIHTNRMPFHLVLTKRLTRLDLGELQSVFNGGLPPVSLRYFDTDREWPPCRRWSTIWD